MGNRATNHIRPATEQRQRTQEDGGEVAERGKEESPLSEMKGEEKEGRETIATIHAKRRIPEEGNR